MLPASKSKGVQFLPESSWARLICDEFHDCSCSRAPQNPSVQASQHKWNGLEPSATASQLRKTGSGGVASSAMIASIFPMAGVNKALTSLRRSE